MSFYFRSISCRRLGQSKQQKDGAVRLWNGSMVDVSRLPGLCVLLRHAFHWGVVGVLSHWWPLRHYHGDHFQVRWWPMEPSWTIEHGSQCKFSCSSFLITDFNFKSHRAQWITNVMIVAGGTGTLSTEKCAINTNGELECTDISPSLSNYTLYQVITAKNCKIFLFIK